MAGPQAAGKSSSIRYLHSKYCIDEQGEYKNPVALQEMRQIVIHKYNIPGAIFVERAEEREIIESDLERMDRILRDDDERTFLDECNVFTLAHARAHGVDFESYYQDYCERLAKLNAGVIFLDISPETSWYRRMPRYEERVQEFPPKERQKIMGMYRSYMFKLKPLLDELYDRLDVPKRKIENDGTTEETLPEVAKAFEEMAQESGIVLCSRF